jgi:hypothetical protein
MICPPLAGQKINGNADSHLNKRPPRIVRLEETLRIKDDGQNIVFSAVKDLLPLDDGSIVFAGYPYIYRFDA